jgi:hypothetical protein
MEGLCGLACEALRGARGKKKGAFVSCVRDKYVTLQWVKLEEFVIVKHASSVKNG